MSSSDGENNVNDKKELPASSEVSHPEYSLSSYAYLNLYHGMDTVDSEKISHYTEMTKEQRGIYESFLEMVRQDANSMDVLQPDDMTCLRFLQADKYYAKKALRRLQDNQVWLKETNIAQLLSNPPSKLETYRKLRARAYMGRTKDNMPIFVERLGDFMCAISSPAGKSLQDKDFVECFLYELGELLAQIRQSYTLDKNSTWRATWIMDCKNISFYRAMKATHTLKLLDALTEPNFPEIAGPIYLINVPSIVSGVWKIIKAFLDPSIVAKIQIHSQVPTELMLERIEKSVLFEEYGGTNQGHFPPAEYS